MHNTHNIHFPVLLFSSDYKLMEFLQNFEQLNVTSKLSLKKESMIGCYIIDSSGSISKILDAKKIKNYYPFWKFEFFNPLVYVDLKLEKVKDNAPLIELKEIILKASKNYSSRKNNRVKTAIEKTTAYKDLISITGSIIDSN